MIVIPTLSLDREISLPLAVGGSAAALGSPAAVDSHAAARHLGAVGSGVVHLSASGPAPTRLARLLEVVRHSTGRFQVELPEADEASLMELLDAGADWATAPSRDDAGARRCGELAALTPGVVVADLSRAGGPANPAPLGLAATLELLEALEQSPLAAVLVAEGPGTVQDLARLEALVEESPWPVLAHSAGDSLQRLRNLADRGVAGAVLSAGRAGEAADLSFLAEEFAS